MSSTIQQPQQPLPEPDLKLDLRHINNLQELKMEQKRVKMRVRIQETELRARVKKLPGELAYAGAKTIVPAFIAGKLTNTALDGLKTGVNNLFDKNKPKTASGLAGAVSGVVPSLVGGLVKQVGVGAILRLGLKLLTRKKSK